MWTVSEDEVLDYLRFAMKKSYSRYQEILAEIADIYSAVSVLQWDREVNAPPKSAEIRARQVATLVSIGHDRFTSEEMGDVLENLAAQGDLDEKQKLNVQESLDDYTKKKKYPRDFVGRMSHARSAAFNTWHKAKTESDFSQFQDALSTLVELKKEEAELLGYEHHPYDALMNEYEKGAKTSEITALFDGVRSKLVDYVKTIGEASQVSDSFIHQHFDKDAQWEMSLGLLRRVGYDFDAGRQDISAHPFTTSFGPTDVRVTTRINENNVTEIITGSIHEAGHALYEQGLPVGDYGLPSGEAVSLGIHESQSRLWENHVGRSLQFWSGAYPEVKKHFPDQLGGVSVEDFYKAINRVEPSLIRTESDELTYHFHIMIRFELEVGLITGDIKVVDLPEAWNAKYKEYLGVDVPSAGQGVLQDVHWSHGSIGYFPTYSLGSFYAAQFFRQACIDIPNLESELIPKGEMQPLLDWLRTNIHKHGRLYPSDELCKRVTGEPLNFEHFWNYAQAKYSAIYGL